MREHEPTHNPTDCPDGVDDDETTLEGWRRLARIVADFLVNAPFEPEPASRSEAGDPGCNIR